MADIGRQPDSGGEDRLGHPDFGRSLAQIAPGDVAAGERASVERLAFANGDALTGEAGREVDGVVTRWLGAGRSDRQRKGDDSGGGGDARSHGFPPSARSRT